jgi:alkylated DNA repair protein (DNA oxidative demethylase)
MDGILPGMEGDAAPLPEGMRVVPNVISGDDELRLLEVLRGLELHPYVAHGQPSLRRVRSFGMARVAGAYDVGEAAPWPDELEPVRDIAATLLGRSREDIVQLHVSHYPPGAGIGWHRDLPVFGSAVAGVSLLSACDLQLRRGDGRGAEKLIAHLESRSGYVISGPARWQWQHRIAPLRSERWSLTMRTLRATDPAG